MSKLERQLDDAIGADRVEIFIGEQDEIDVGALHQLLRNEIDSRTHRVSLDLRGVYGAPPELIGVLIDSQSYARSKGKYLAVAYATPEMREALRPRRPSHVSSDGVDDDMREGPTAGDAAKSLLDKRHEDTDEYDISKAEKISRKESQQSPAERRRKAKLKRYAQLGALVVVSVAVIGAVEWWLVFGQRPATVMPVKTFEDGRMP